MPDRLLAHTRACPASQSECPARSGRRPLPPIAPRKPCKEREVCRKPCKLQRYQNVAICDNTAFTGGRKVVDSAADWQAGPLGGATDSMAKAKAKCASCKDCYFGANGLCALKLNG